MTRLEQIEMLREKVNVTYEEAQQALEMAEGDLLEAIIMLEKQGKVAASAVGNQERTEEEPTIKKVKRNNIAEAIDNIGRFCVDVIDKGNNSFVEVIKEPGDAFRMPLTVLALLLIFLPYITLPVAVIALLLGYRYRLHGLGTSG